MDLNDNKINNAKRLHTPINFMNSTQTHTNPINHKPNATADTQSLTKTHIDRHRNRQTL